MVSHTLTPLVGRDTEMRQIIALLDAGHIRLLTLTGPGGVGKTRLALDAMATLQPDFADGAVFVPLASIRDAHLVPSVIAKACGVPERGDMPVRDRLTNGLGGQHRLLVLDNYEHLLEGDPAWLAELLEACPRLTVLVTSRTALNLAGEQRYPVPPLSVPEAGLGDNVTETPAMTLFAQRAHAVRPTFSMTADNRVNIGELCRRLDGLPLAIELAAARITVLTPADMVARLSDRFTVLAGGPRNAPARSRSMRDAIAWSYDLLTTDDQRVFRTLAIFVGGFTLEAAEAVVQLPDGTSRFVVNDIASLVEKSLIQPVEQTSDDPRFTMLETIREFGLAQLVRSGEETDVRNRSAEWCLTLARDSRAGSDVIQNALAVDRLEREHANIQATLKWLDQTGQAGRLLDFMNDLEFFWNFGGHDVEGLIWYRRALEEPRNGSPSDRLDGLAAAGILAHAVNDPMADSYIEQAVVLARQLGTAAQRANAIAVAAIRAEDLGDYATAEACLRESEGYARQAGLADVSIMIDYHLGIVAYGQGNLDQAVERLEDARLAATAIQDPFVPLWCLVHLALIACDRGNPTAAADLLRQHPTLERVGYRQHQPLVRAAAGVLATGLGHHELAARFFGSTAHDVGLFYPERVIIERSIGRSRHILGDERFTGAWEAGRRMRQHEVEAELHRLLSADSDRVIPPAAPNTSATGLSPREMDVLRLLADGLSNQRIAESLFVSRRTVDNHIANILGKLTVESRTAAVAYAIRHDLV